jgi:hypothetical protein
MGWNYTPDHSGVSGYLRNEPALRAELERRAHVGLGVGRALAPRRTGKLAESGHVVFDGSRGGARHDRMAFSVIFDVSYAAAATWPGRTAYLDAVKASMEGA